MLKINDEALDEGIRCAICTNNMKSDRGCDGNCKVNEHLYDRIMKVIDACTIKDDKCI